MTFPPGPIPAEPGLGGSGPPECYRPRPRSHSILAQFGCLTAAVMDNGGLPRPLADAQPRARDQFGDAHDYRQHCRPGYAPCMPMAVSDWAGLERLLDLHLEAGTSAIGAVGTTGESATPSVEEHCEVIRRCVDYLAGRLPVVAGTGSNSTRAIAHPGRGGGRAGRSLPAGHPYYNRPTQDAACTSISKALAGGGHVPQILYNVPGRTCVDMAMTTVARLAGWTISSVSRTPPVICSGRDSSPAVASGFAIYPAMTHRYGILIWPAAGNISVTANVAPAPMAEMSAGPGR